MKFEFYQNGRQFFFITLAVEGRKKILAEVIEETHEERGRAPEPPRGVGAAARSVAKRRALPQSVPSALGERVVSLWLKLHALCPALTASNFVIMPDHVHLLLMVDFARLQGRFNPLVFIHWFRDWSSRAGDVEPVAPRNWFEFYEPGEVTRVIAWEEGFWLDLAMGSRHLKAIRHYMKLNPARLLWKLRHPDRFQVVKVATARLFAHEERGHAPEPPRVGQALEPPRVGQALETLGGAGGSGVSPVPCLPPVLTALGDIGLLGSPFLLHVRLTLKKTVAEHAAAIDEIVEKAKRGYIPVSGFISPGEKEALRRLKAEPHVRFVKLVPFALPPRYDPSAEDSRELAADRLAIVSLQPETAAIRTLDIRRSQAAAHAFRVNCLAMNDLAASLCGRGR